MNDPQALLDEMERHAAELGVPSILGYSRVMAIDSRSAGAEDSTNLLSLAKKRALDPTIFDEHAPFFFGGEASSQRWDAYDTRMGISSLENYARDAATGVAYLSGHNNRVDPHGGTLTGLFTPGAGKRTATFRADVFMIQDPASQAFISKIRAGIVKDQSIGFYGGEYMCSICNRDMTQWWTADGCPHILGMMYAPTDAKGKEKEGAERVKARATIENSNLGEISGVYDGATPGAMIDKARSMATQGELDTRTREFVQVRYNITLPGGSRIIPVAKREVRQMTEEEIQALQDALAKVTRERDAHAKALATLNDVTQRAKLPTTFEGKPLEEAVDFLATERQRLIPLADDGRQYRTDLIESALAEGVRAMGTNFKQETYKGVLEASPIEAIKRMRDDWAEVAKKTFPEGGRQFKEGEGKPTEPKTTALDRRQHRAYQA